MYIDPYHERESPSSGYYTQGFSNESIMFDWNITAYMAPVLFVKLTFFDTERISPGKEQDYLVINVTKLDQSVNMSTSSLFEDQKNCYINETIGK